MKQPRKSRLSQKAAGLALALVGLGGLLGGPGEARAQVATVSILDGPIDRISVDNIADHWSGGIIEVNGQKVIIPYVIRSGQGEILDLGYLPVESIRVQQQP